jgi:hypothetical protein
MRISYRDAIRHNPFAAPKGQSEAAWKEVAESVAGYGKGMEFNKRSSE